MSLTMDSVRVVGYAQRDVVNHPRISARNLLERRLRAGLLELQKQVLRTLPAG